MPDLAARVAELERWARANLPRLHALPADQASDELGDALLAIDRQLGVEIEDRISDARTLIVTSFSDPTRRATARALRPAHRRPGRVHPRPRVAARRRRAPVSKRTCARSRHRMHRASRRLRGDRLAR